MQGTSDPTRVELLDAGALCRHLVPDGSVHAFLADHRQQLFPDELFADLFGSGRGRPSVPADVVATVMVLQALEGLSDRDACQQLACNIAWKVACGLALPDRGFHPSVLTLWRARLRGSDRPERIFDAVRQVVQATGVLRGRVRRALDSTLLDDAVATQDTVTQLVAAVRRVRRLVPPAAAVAVAAHDYDGDPGKPACAWDDAQAREQLVSALVNDARATLAAIDGAELSGEQAEAAGLLALVAGQDVEPGETDGSWRIARTVSPDRVLSVVDPQARHMHKSRSVYRDGYKAHLAVEPETGLITAAALTPASTPDGPTGVGLLAGEPAGLEVLADSAYGSGQTRAALHAAGHTQTIKPIPLRPAVPGGFTRDDFQLDLTAGTVTCPAGQTVAMTPARKAVFGWRCRGCPLAARCTQAARGRTLELHPHEGELRAARRRATDPEFQASYRRWRPMVERSIAWLVADGHRRVRYRGVTRNQHGLQLRVAAINLRRLLALGLTHNQQGWALT
ncbi:MAG TPA: IS1182 family transposase [Actinomycetota bacterium]|nr:IS1182 family transposase [Actinomycetota bacterium]